MTAVFSNPSPPALTLLLLSVTLLPVAQSFAVVPGKLQFLLPPLASGWTSSPPSLLLCRVAKNDNNNNDGDNNNNNNNEPSTMIPPSQALLKRWDTRKARIESMVKAFLQNATTFLDTQRNELRLTLRCEIQQIRSDVLQHISATPEANNNTNDETIRKDPTDGFDQNSTTTLIHATIVDARTELKQELNVVLQKQRDALLEFEALMNNITAEMGKVVYQLYEMAKTQEEYMPSPERWKEIEVGVREQERQLSLDAFDPKPTTSNDEKGQPQGTATTNSPLSDVNPLEQKVHRAINDFELKMKDQLLDLRDDVLFLLGVVTTPADVDANDGDDND